MAYWAFDSIAENAVVYLQSSNIELQSLLNVGIEYDQIK